MTGNRKAYLYLYPCSRWVFYGVCNRREVVVTLLEGKCVRDCSQRVRLRSETRPRTDSECRSGETCIAWTRVGRASWVRNGGRWQVDVEMVIGEAVGLHRARRVAASGKRRDETGRALPRSHRMIASESGAAGFCMAVLVTVGCVREPDKASSGWLIV